MVHSRYEVDGKLGYGGQGIVYRVYDRKAKKYRGMKTAFGDTNKEALRREAEILGSIRHRKIPALIQCFPWRGGLCAVMELMPGETLEEDVHFTEEELIRLGISLCRILEYLHGREPPVLYLDLKPSNILIGRGGIRALVDFGCAVQQGRTLGQALCGTRAYAAPEQFRESGTLTVRTDIYALGRVMKKLSQAGGMSSRTEAVWNRCCEASPDRRYPSARAVRVALYQCRRTCLGRSKASLLASPEIRRRAAVLGGTACVSMTLMLSAKMWEDWQYARCQKVLTEALNIPFGQEEESLFRRLQYEDAGGGRTRIAVLASREEEYGKFLYEIGLRYWYGYEEEGGQWRAFGWLEQAEERNLPEQEQMSVQDYLALKPYYAWRRGEEELTKAQWQQILDAWKRLLSREQEAVLAGWNSWEGREEVLEREYRQFAEEMHREGMTD